MNCSRALNSLLVAEISLVIKAFLIRLPILRPTTSYQQPVDK
jgi:hypothetical protein